MDSKTRHSLISINGGLLIIFVSPFFRKFSEFFYYSFIFIGLFIAISATINFFRENKKNKENK